MMIVLMYPEEPIGEDKIPLLKEKIPQKFPGIELVGYDYEINPYSIILHTTELPGKVLEEILKTMEPTDFTIIDDVQTEQSTKKKKKKKKLKRKIEALLEEE